VISTLSRQAPRQISFGCPARGIRQGKASAIPSRRYADRVNFFLHKASTSLLSTVTYKNSLKLRPLGKKQPDAMSAASRWADTAADLEAEKRRKQQKEARKRAKAELAARKAEAEAARAPEITEATTHSGDENGHEGRPRKRIRVSAEPEPGRSAAKGSEQDAPKSHLRKTTTVSWSPCRHVSVFDKLNDIEEGSYGFVSRAQERGTGLIVALKKLKMENAQDGFPVTGLREIQTLMAARHDNIVGLREVVMGDTLDE
jgi:cell division cycle 2-like protein